MATAHDLAMRLRVAYLAMHRRTGASLAPLGLTADQFVLLTALADGDAVSQQELVRRTGSDPNTMSEMLARLERRGLVLRERHADDRRALRVTLTAEGRRLQRASWRASDPLRRALQGPFPPAALDALVEHLDRIAGAMSPARDSEGPSACRGSSRGPPTPGRRRLRADREREG